MKYKTGSILECNNSDVTLGKFLDSGGNGVVYYVEKITNKTTKEDIKGKFVIKILYKTSKKRVERFKREIDFLVKYNSKIDGLIKIIDYKFDIIKDCYWYVMDECTSINFSSYTLLDKLNFLLDVGNTISVLHKIDNKGFSHRDIKPSNIMINNGKAVLLDYGLLWDVSNPRITDNGERVGPILIAPPELRDPHLTTDFRPSDVYLFAKVIWIYITKKEEGFLGEYRRENKLHYLNCEDFGVTTLEPIQLLLEKCTWDDYKQRIGIDECIDYLKRQISILNGSIKKDELEEFQRQEICKKYIKNSRKISSEFELNDANILDYFKSLPLGTTIQISGERNYQVNFQMFYKLDNGLYCINTQSSFYKSLYFNVLSTSFNNDKNELVFKLGNVDSTILLKHSPSKPSDVLRRTSTISITY